MRKQTTVFYNNSAALCASVVASETHAHGAVVIVEALALQKYKKPGSYFFQAVEWMLWTSACHSRFQTLH